MVRIVAYVRDGSEAPDQTPEQESRSKVSNTFAGVVLNCATGNLMCCEKKRGTVKGKC